MKKTALFLLIYIFTLIPVVRAEEISLVLDEAVAIALRDNRDILLKAEDVKKQKAKIDEARSGLYPTLDLSGNLSRNMGYYSKDFSYNTYQLTLKHTLYSGGATGNNIKYNEYMLEADNAILDKARLDIAFGVKKAFYTLLLADIYANINKAILNNTVGHFDSVQARYKSGQASGSDILAMRSSLESVRQEYESSLNEAAAARALLNNYLYLDKDVRIMPKGEFIYRKDDVEYDKMLLDALKNRPEIRQYDNQALAAEKNVGITSSGNKPVVYASWDYYNRSHGAAGTARNRSDYNIMGVTVSWPVFDGWLTRSKIEQANIDLKEARITREKAGRDIALELKNAYLSWRDAVAKINAERSGLETYRDNLMTVKKKFKDGMASFLDVRDAGLKYSISKFNNTQAVYDYIIAKNELDKAMGAL